MYRVWIKGVGVGCPADNHHVKLGCPPKIVVVHKTIYNKTLSIRQCKFVCYVKMNA